MTSPLAQRLRHEARLLRATARSTWLLGEDLVEQATKLNAQAAVLEDQAEEADELAAAEPWIGPNVRARKAKAA